MPALLLFPPACRSCSSLRLCSSALLLSPSLLLGPALLLVSRCPGGLFSSSQGAQEASFNGVEEPERLLLTVLRSLRGLFNSPRGAGRPL